MFGVTSGPEGQSVNHPDTPIPRTPFAWSFVAGGTQLPGSVVSGEENPFHVSPYLVEFRGFPSCPLVACASAGAR